MSANSGKSTLLLTLLGMTEYSGSIKIDGRDLYSIPRSTIRRRCFITVPQDPFLMPDATLRFNMDPSASIPDHVLISALSKVGLWSHLFYGAMAQSGRAGGTELDQRLRDLPVMSVGQVQLLAM